MRHIKRAAAVITTFALTLSPLSILANGLGEGRPFQFRSDTQRQVLLTLERSRLELLGLLGSGTGGVGGGSGQTGNAVSINVSGSNNEITVIQTNTGHQTQCSDFSITGGMFGVTAGAGGSGGAGTGSVGGASGIGGAC